MKLFFLIVVIGLADIITASTINRPKQLPVTIREEIDPIVTRKYTTRLNHFEPQDSRSVELTYTYNPRNSKLNGPLLVLINNGEVNPDVWLEQGLLHDVARDVNGTLFNLYTRYHGPNNVTENASVRNLKYLTVEQILADIAVFVNTIREEFNTSNSRVILTGSGFGGTLATWAKQRYPHLIYGSWSSSGIFNRTLHTAEPYEALSRVITEHGGAHCAQNVFNAFELIEEHLQNFEIFYIEEIFDLCIFVLPYLEDEMAMFFGGLINYIVEYLDTHHYDGIIEFCNAMNQSNATIPIDQVFANWVLSTYSTGECLDYDYDSNIRKLRNESWDSLTSQNGARSRLYLQCTQLATHATTVNGNTLFGRTIAQDYYLNLCLDVLGYDFDYMASIDALNHLKIQHGTNDPGSSRQIFSNGLLDINFAFGITIDDEEIDNFIINIPHAAKSADIFEMSEEDNVYTAAAKYAIHEIIVKWCNED